MGSNPFDSVAIMIQVNASSLHINFKLVDQRTVDKVHESDKRVVTWGSVEAISVLKRLARIGGDVVGSNRPDIMIEYLKSRDLHRGKGWLKLLYKVAVLRESQDCLDS